MGQRTVVIDERTLYQNEPVKVKSALGPDLYGGTSGIALFLAHLYYLTGDSRYREHAEGGANQAFSQAERIPSHSIFGFYGGLVGIIFALAEVGRILESARLVRRSSRLLESLDDGLERAHWLDMVSGNAGAIPVLIRLAERFPGLRIMNLARRLGAELVEKAVKEETGWSWGNEQITPRMQGRNLTGYSHGAAGIGYGLLQLFRNTREERFLQGAEEAFRYENNWYDPMHNNWPDFREDRSSIEEGPDTYSYPVAWCHGASGIGLSRLRAYDVLGDEVYLRDSLNSLARTTDAIRNSMKDPDDLSLCHGTFGRCELLILASETLNDRQYLELARVAAEKAIDMFEGADAAWPCGIEEGETPGLMLGLAGLGYFFLRLHNTRLVRSILAI